MRYFVKTFGLMLCTKPMKIIGIEVISQDDIVDEIVKVLKQFVEPGNEPPSSRIQEGCKVVIPMRRDRGRLGDGLLALECWVITKVIQQHLVLWVI